MDDVVFDEVVNSRPSGFWVLPAATLLLTTLVLVLVQPPFIRYSQADEFESPPINYRVVFVYSVLAALVVVIVPLFYG